MEVAQVDQERAPDQRDPDLKSNPLASHQAHRTASRPTPEGDKPVHATRNPAPSMSLCESICGGMSHLKHTAALARSVAFRPARRRKYGQLGLKADDRCDQWPIIVARMLMPRANTMVL